MPALRKFLRRTLCPLVLSAASACAQPHPIEGLWKKETARIILVRHYFQGRYFELCFTNKGRSIVQSQTGSFKVTGDTITEEAKFASPGWKFKLDSPQTERKFFIVDDQMTLARLPEEEKELWERILKDPTPVIKNTAVPFSRDATTLEGNWISEIEPINKINSQYGKNRFKSFYRGWVIEVELWNPGFVVACQMGIYQIDGNNLNQRFHLANRTRVMEEGDIKAVIQFIDKDQFQQTSSDGSKTLWKRLSSPQN